ncbi:hypothetical protein C3B51_12515 [Pseudoalteromonas rubra]|uniref:TonB-dependent receptor-like beta-barrel domain-containing protein n=1 Tax=Pseudoalteromonas rubra TaxID=43658 RepID=A0A4Q7ECS0_9GAMM|nr:TonB-dependent receptor [Pseudoalteromonas rubra]RZM80375.1 hypothetical protein C3B51_12515 [Pseudoalteromonas rubra]
MTKRHTFAAFRPACLSASILLLFALMVTSSLRVSAQSSEACQENTCSTSYPVSFFDIYAPVSALDMVRNLPGFELDNGDSESRGFGGSAGNVLISGERISTKNDSISDILARIPAADVKEVVVIRGQTGGLDLVGQSVVANVVRKGKGASGTWNFYGAINAPDTDFQPFLEVTFTDMIDDLNYTVALSGGKYKVINESNENIVNGQGGVTERREEKLDVDGEDFSFSLNATLDNHLGKFSFNTSFDYFDETGGETSIRRPANGIASSLFEASSERSSSFEVGLDYEKTLGKEWNTKLIGVHTRDNIDSTGALSVGQPEALGTIFTRTTFDTVETETIVRLELDYTGIQGQLIEIFAEGTVNELESQFALSERVDDKDRLIDIDVPGAVTTVKEERVDFGASNAFKLGEINLDALMGAEYSNISQTGGFAEKRNFFFWKPNLSASYNVNPSTLIRSRLFREIGQLDFFDFVSQADLGDVELSLGNPTLEPQTTITFGLDIETRFGELGLISISAFYDEISDVIDLLPLEGVLEIPGNIGDGRRSGFTTEITLPLDAILLKQGRLDVSGRWQDTEVTDPLTGSKRVLSNERQWEAEATLRQDITERNLAWSITVSAFDDLPQFGLDEIDIQGGYFDIDAFIEVRAFSDIRVRFGVENAFRHGPSRERSVFEGSRNASILAFVEDRQRSLSREWFVDVSGNF